MCGLKFWTVVDAMSKYAKKKSVTFVKGIPTVLSTNESGIAAAVAACAAADTCVVAVGSDLTWAKEGHDAKNISYTAAQQQLIKRAAAAAKRPIIVVTLTAVPLDISFFKNLDKVGAIVHAGQPSVTVYGLARLSSFVPRLSFFVPAFSSLFFVRFLPCFQTFTLEIAVGAPII